MKKHLLCLFALALVLVLSGCGHEHEWTSATCTKPETCECGETRGEALGHDWRPADCTAPETCKFCGETRGEPLGHTPTEANYQEASVCTVCGEVLGEPLEASFPANGLAANMELGVPVDYHTICSDGEHSTVGVATMTDYRVFDSDETHAAREGYEWRCVTMLIEFADENAQLYGVRYNRIYEDWYTIELHDDTNTAQGDGSVYQVLWHGELQEALSRSNQIPTERPEGGWLIEITWDYQVPKGYDGVVVGMLDTSLEWPEGAYIYDVADENTLFFRMK